MTIGDTLCETSVAAGGPPPATANALAELETVVSAKTEPQVTTFHLKLHGSCPVGGDDVAEKSLGLANWQYRAVALDWPFKTTAFCRGLDISMPLMRGAVDGYDADRMVFRFTMLNDAHIIECEISAAALDDMAGGRWISGRTTDREAQFAEYREAIEELASKLYGSRLVNAEKRVRIFAKHVRAK